LLAKQITVPGLVGGFFKFFFNTFLKLFFFTTFSTSDLVICDERLNAKNQDHTQKPG